MEGIRTAIELQDHFSGVLMNIINAANLSVSAIEQMQAVMNGPVNTASIQGMRAQLDEAALAAQELNAAMQGIEGPGPVSFPDIPAGGIPGPGGAKVPALDAAGVQPRTAVPERVTIPVVPQMTERPRVDLPEEITVPVTPQITEQPQVDIPEGLTVDVSAAVTKQPQIDLPEGLSVPVTPQVTEQPKFDVPESVRVDVSVSGLPESEAQAAGLTERLQDISRLQEAIREIAASVYVLPEDTEKEISGINREIGRMQAAMDFLESNPFDLNTEIAKFQVESISASLDELAGKQRKIDGYMEHAASRLVVAGQGPVEIPVRWQAYEGPEVFTGTGIERFGQEVQSADAMLASLNRTQAQVAAGMAGIRGFPPDMAADMGRMQGRLQAIQGRIQAISGNPLNMGTDTANAGLEQLRAQLTQAVQEQGRMNQAVADMDVGAANEAYLRLSETIGGTERYLRDNVDGQGRFNQEIRQGAQDADRLMGTIKRAVAAYATMQTASKVLDLSDTLASTTARLNLMNEMNGSLHTTGELQDMIWLSAERARGSYQATADAVSKLGLMAGNAFSGNEEIIAFMEQVNKQFAIAGTSAAGIDAAMLQLTQAMSSGVLRGEEYNSILEQAPNIIQSITGYIEGNEAVLSSVASSMGMTAEELSGNVQGHMKDIAGEGLLSAELVKAALFQAADETNAKFENMPKTFGQIWTSFQNTALIAFQPVLERINGIGNSEGFQTFVDGAVNGLVMVADTALNVFDIMTAGAGLVADNWSWLLPVIYGVAAALAVYGGYLAMTKGMELASAAAKGIMVVAEYAYAAATGTAVAATTAQTAAQMGLNTALLACPVTWIVLAVVAFVAAIYAAVAAVNHFAGTSVSATGLIAAVFAVLGAFLINTFVMPLWNGFAMLANFFGNVFNDPVAAVKVLFYDMCLTVIGYIQKLAQAVETLLNKIPGVTVDITSGLDNFYSGLEQAQQAVKDESGWVEYVRKMDFIDYRDAANAGYSFGEGMESRLSGFDMTSFFGGGLPDAGSYEDLSRYEVPVPPGLGDIGSGVDDIAGNTGAIADSLDVTEEDLKWLRDIAEQEAVNRFTIAEIKIDQTNHNNIKNGMDLDGVVSGLTDAMLEAIDSSAEGVHV